MPCLEEALLEELGALSEPCKLSGEEESCKPGLEAQTIGGRSISPFQRIKLRWFPFYFWGFRNYPTGCE
jgi:hypothetical protein